MATNTATPADRNDNCAMCAIAGTIGSSTSYVQRVVGAHGQSDDALQAAWAIPGDAEALFIAATEKVWRFIYLELRKRDLWFGYRSGKCYADLKDRGALRLWMNHFPVGTRFAVWGCEEMNGLSAHWNCARKVAADTITFIDYQYNHGANPPQAAAQFVEPQGGGHYDYVKFVAFAFTQTPVRGVN